MKQSEDEVRTDQVTEEVSAPPITPTQLLALFLRDAANHPDLTDETSCSFGWWKTIPGDEYPTFNARLKVTLGELRRGLDYEIALGSAAAKESERAP